MRKKSYILALFNDFEAAAKAIAMLRESSLKGFRMQDVTLKSPIDHPECAAEPPNMVITYELFILTAVFFTIIACYVVFTIYYERNSLYNTAVSVDKIGILVKAEPAAVAGIREIFTRYHALEISEST